MVDDDDLESFVDQNDKEEKKTKERSAVTGKSFCSICCVYGKTFQHLHKCLPNRLPFYYHTLLFMERFVECFSPLARKSICCFFSKFSVGTFAADQEHLNGDFIDHQSRPIDERLKSGQSDPKKWCTRLNGLVQMIFSFALIRVYFEYRRFQRLPRKWWW